MFVFGGFIVDIFIKTKIKRVFAKNFARIYEKKIILGTSDAFMMSHLAHGPSDPVIIIFHVIIGGLMMSGNLTVPGSE